MWTLSSGAKTGVVGILSSDEDATDVTDEVPLTSSGGDNPLTKLVDSENNMLLFLW